MKTGFLISAAVALIAIGSTSHANINIETVFVGDAGNVADTLIRNDASSGFGTVSYNYNIGKYEVTAGQYTAFLNATAKSDPYHLYSNGMLSNSLGSGITRLGSDGNYTYVVADDFVNRPVNNVNFWDACRFTNWLNNGQGKSDTETGTYTLNGYLGDTDQSIHRNSGAIWAIASEDEWYKSAYYKGGGTNTGYWLYPTSSDSDPGRDPGDNSGNNANIWSNSGPYPIDGSHYTTVGGEFQNSSSSYGTYDQAGNVFEWTDSLSSGSARVVPGGSYSNAAVNTQSWARNFEYPTNETNDFGFRVVQLVPEPSALVVILCGLGSSLVFNRKSL